MEEGDTVSLPEIRERQGTASPVWDHMAECEEVTQGIWGTSAQDWYPRNCQALKRPADRQGGQASTGPEEASHVKGGTAPHLSANGLAGSQETRYGRGV